MTNDELVRAFARASAERDDATIARLRHPAWTVEWPQSGERVTSADAFDQIMALYPGGAPTAVVGRIIGAEDRWVVTPGNTPLRVVGEGDFWWAEWQMTYPDGQAYHCIDLIELRDGAVYRERVFWAPLLEPPAWRAPFVEPVGA